MSARVKDIFIGPAHKGDHVLRLYLPAAVSGQHVDFLLDNAALLKLGLAIAARLSEDRDASLKLDTVSARSADQKGHSSS
jgi:hypothetical protein